MKTKNIMIAASAIALMLGGVAFAGTVQQPANYVPASYDQCAAWVGGTVSSGNTTAWYSNINGKDYAKTVQSTCSAYVYPNAPSTSGGRRVSFTKTISYTLSCSSAAA